MDLSNKVVGISGIGLMGGSLAAAIKKYLPQTTVKGFDPDQVASINAKKRSLVDETESTFDVLANSVDILFLAGPASSVLEQIKNLHSYARDLIVSDLCSVKRPVMKAAETLGGNMVFIGGHPMAGSQYTGNEHADPDIFQNAAYILCPPVTGSIPKVLTTIIKSIGARPVIIPPYEHDKAVSQVSHVPQLLAVALLNDLLIHNEADSATYSLAAGGFKDVTRIGESSFSLWKEILEKNKDNVIADLSKLIARLNNYKESLQKGELENVGKEFTNARKARDRFKLK